jgi:hypothetical protein
MVLRDELMRDKERLERELAQAKKALEAPVSRAG